MQQTTGTSRYCQCHYKTTALVALRDETSGHMKRLNHELILLHQFTRQCRADSLLYDSQAVTRRIRAADMIIDGIWSELERSKNVVKTCEQNIVQVESKCKQLNHLGRTSSIRPIRHLATVLDEAMEHDVGVSASDTPSDSESLLEAIQANRLVHDMLRDAGLLEEPTE